jgi:hypothetical protein
MIHSEEVPHLIKSALPAFQSLVDDYVKDLGDGAHYPILTEVVGTLLSEYGSSHTSRAEQDLKKLFLLTEKALVEGDASTRDLFALEVIERLAEPDVQSLGLQHLLPRNVREELARILHP